MPTQKQFLDKFTVMLRHYREAAGMSQSDVADALKIGLRSYQRYESGESVPSIDIIYLLSKVLQFELKHFFSPQDQAQELKDFKLLSSEEELRSKTEAAADLLTIARGPQFIEALKSSDLKEFRNVSSFYSSSLPMAISTPRSTLLNTAAQKLAGIAHDVVSSSINQTDHIALGIIWATLIGHEEAFFELSSTPHLPKGKIKLESRGIFLNKDNHYLTLSVIETRPLTASLP